MVNESQFEGVYILFFYFFKKKSSWESMLDLQRLGHDPSNYEVNKFKFKVEHTPESKLLSWTIESQTSFLWDD